MRKWLGAAGNSLGEAYGSEGKIPESQAAYDAAAKANPPGASMYYTNEAIVMDRNNQLDATVAAAEKAIAADPAKPIPYYLKGKALINKATIDPKTQKIVAPPGTAEAYQKYLRSGANGAVCRRCETGAGGAEARRRRPIIRREEALEGN